MKSSFIFETVSYFIGKNSGVFVAHTRCGNHIICVCVSSDNIKILRYGTFPRAVRACQNQHHRLFSDILFLSVGSFYIRFFGFSVIFGNRFFANYSSSNDVGKEILVIKDWTKFIICHLKNLLWRNIFVTILYHSVLIMSNIPCVNMMIPQNKSITKTPVGNSTNGRSCYLATKSSRDGWVR